MVKIRLVGLPEEVQAAADRIAGAMAVLEVSKPYPRRASSRLVSLYIEADPGAKAAPSQDGDGDARP